MELLGIAEIQQYALPVASVVILALIVLALGFRPAPELPFDKLSNESNLDDRKAAKRRSKPKEKKTQANGQVAASATKAVPETETEAKKPQQPTKPVVKKVPAAPANKAKTVGKVEAKPNRQVEVKNKKNKKGVNNNIEENRNEIPEGFDDAGWIQAVNKKDKKLRNKREDGELKSDVSSPDATPSHKKKITPTESEKRVETVSAPVVAAPAPVTEEKAATAPSATPVIAEPAAPVQPEPSQRTKEDKKRKKKAAVAASGNVTPAADVTPAPVTVATPPAPVAASPVPAQPSKEPEPVALPPQASEDNSNVAFDELGDPWQETKAQKKKKKARRD